MNPSDQILLVNELSNAIITGVLLDIVACRVPNSWDGHELRLLIAERFAGAVTGTMAKSTPRYRQYRRAVRRNQL
jgi:hypothetical protein